MDRTYTSFTLLAEIYRDATQGLCAKGYKTRNMQRKEKSRVSIRNVEMTVVPISIRFSWRGDTYFCVRNLMDL